MTAFQSKRRLLVTACAFALLLMPILAAALQTLEEARTYTRYSTLLGRLHSAALRLDAELGRAALRPAADAEAMARASYREALAAFSALRAGDGERSAQPQWAVLENEYRVDPDAELERFGLAGRAMPPDLHEAWAGRADGGWSAQEAVAELLLLARPLLRAQTSPTPDASSQLEALRNLGRTRLSPALESATAIGRERAAAGAHLMLYLLIAGALAGGLAAAFGAALVRPRPEARQRFTARARMPRRGRLSPSRRAAGTRDGLNRRSWPEPYSGG